jgi:RNA-directed DNA polymerase
MAKSFNISKQMVWDSYLKVKANKGAAGIDRQTMEDFDTDLRKNLYKIWNRLSSGSYFPPAVRRVDIPKGNGKTRPLGIPTISDRIAQMVVKDILEPIVDPNFHNDSYGYRPGKSAHDAIAKARQRCWRDNWVLDMDIRGFFDAIDHSLVMKAISYFTSNPWVLLYIKRWLEADVMFQDGTLEKRTTGTPQGGVISPLLANVFLHFVFDKWMEKEFPNVHFERYADDIVVHCRSYKQLKLVESKLKDRFYECKLELCPEKTKIVYCKDSNRTENYEHCSFDFLGFTFRPRSSRSEAGRFFVSFSPAVSQKKLTLMRRTIKHHPVISGCYSKSIEECAHDINPIIQGWINYYGRFRKSSLTSLYRYINDKLTRWVMRKFKSLQRRITQAGKWLKNLYLQNPNLFAHWKHYNWVTE